MSVFTAPELLWEMRCWPIVGHAVATGSKTVPAYRRDANTRLRKPIAKGDPPPLKWSAVMFRKTEDQNGYEETQAGRDCHEAAAG